MLIIFFSRKRLKMFIQLFKFAMRADGSWNTVIDYSDESSLRLPEALLYGAKRIAGIADQARSEELNFLTVLGREIEKHAALGGGYIKITVSPERPYNWKKTLSDWGYEVETDPGTSFCTVSWEHLMEKK